MCRQCNWAQCWIDDSSQTVVPPGLGLDWPCTFSTSTAERVVERVYYLLRGGVSSKVIKYALGDLLSSWQEYLGQTVFINAWVHSFPGQHPLKDGLPNSLHWSEWPERQNPLAETCWAPNEQDPANPRCKSLHWVRAIPTPGRSQGEMCHLSPWSIKISSVESDHMLGLRFLFLFTENTSVFAES